VPTDDELLAQSFGAPDVASPKDDAALAATFDKVSSGEMPETALLASSFPDAVPASKKVPSSLTKLEYGFEKAETIYGNVQKWVTAHAPAETMEISNKISGYLHQLKQDNPMLKWSVLGLARNSTTAEYGEDFLKLDPDQRIVRMNLVDKAKLVAEFPNMQGHEGFVSGTGEVVGSIVKDPFTYAGIGVGGAAVKGSKTLWDFMKATSPVGAAWGASWEGMHELANENQLHLIPVGVAALGGAILAPTLPWGIGKLGGVVGRQLDKVATKNAGALVDDVQTRLVAKMVDGGPRMQALQEVLVEKGMTMKELNHAMARTETKTAGLFIPKDQAAAQHLAVDAQPVGWRPFKSGTWMDDIIQPISSRIGEINQGVKLRLNKMEMNIHSRTHNIPLEGDKLFSAIDNMSSESQLLFKKAWTSRDLVTIKRLVKDNPAALRGLDYIRATLNDLHGEYSRVVDPKLTYLTEYLPRLVKDYPALREQLGKGPRNVLDTLLAQTSQKKGRALTELEQVDIVGKWMRGYPRSEMKAGFRKARELHDVLPDNILETYASPRDAYHAYVRRSIMDIEKAKFFGSGNVKLSVLNNTIDTEGTLANYIAKDPDLLKDGNKLVELRKLLQARFDAGESAPSAVVSNLRNITYMATIANPFSAMTQATDIAFSAAQAGLPNLLRTVGRGSLKEINAGLFGLQKASEELAEASMASARLLDRTLKLAQFTAVDLFGKTRNLRTNFVKYTRLAQTEAGIEKLAKKYSAAYGDDFAHLVDDLRNKRVTENTKLLLWSELAEIQPISKSEMPLKYLQAPNGRIFYALMSFTLKQFDYVRRNIYGQFKAGNIVEGSKNLATFSAYLSAAGVGKTALQNWILGKEMNAEDYRTAAIVGFWKNFAVTPGVIYKILSAGEKKQTISGKLVAKGQAATRELAGGIGVPILDIVSAAGSDALGMLDESDPYAPKSQQKGKTYKSLRYIPLGGPLLYNFFGGGLEKWNQESEKRRLSKYEPNG